MSASDLSSPALEDFAQLDDISLRQRWRRMMGRPMPEGLGRALALRVLAYQRQARLYGDLDPATRRALADVLRARQTSKSSIDVAEVARSSSNSMPKANASPLLRPGTIVAREHGGLLHRVMVMEQGFCWNGRTYDSLSKVAFAITGTRWNGPRFFGLRDKGKQPGNSYAPRTKKQGGPASAGALSRPTTQEIAL